MNWIIKISFLSFISCIAVYGAYPELSIINAVGSPLILSVETPYTDQSRRVRHDQYTVSYYPDERIQKINLTQWFELPSSEKRLAIGFSSLPQPYRFFFMDDLLNDMKSSLRSKYARSDEYEIKWHQIYRVSEHGGKLFVKVEPHSWFEKFIEQIIKDLY